MNSKTLRGNGFSDDNASSIDASFLPYVTELSYVSSHASAAMMPYAVTANQGTAPVASASVSASTVMVTTGGITFDLIFDAAAMAAPASFRTGIEQAATMLANAISDKITLNIKIDYSGTGGGAFAGPDNGSYQSYSLVHTDLLKAASGTTFNALPSGSSVQGQSSLIVWNAQMKLFGLLGANDTTTDDGSATFATDINPSLLAGVALHELTHALGRVPYGPAPDIFDLFRYTSPGVRLFQGGNSAPASYFSLDGGVTKLADFGQNSDPSDFLNSGVQGPNDPFNEVYSGSTSQTLTSVDRLMLQALGFNAGAGTGLPAPPVQAGSGSGGHLPANGGGSGTTINVHDISLAENSTVAGSSFITSVSNPNGDNIGGYAFWDLGDGTGHFTLNGVTQADGQWIVVDSSHLSSVQYVGGSVSGSETLDVEVYDSTTSSWSNYSTLKATTSLSQPVTTQGTAGNDTFHAGGGNKSFNGGGGHDTVIFDGSSSQYALSQHADGSVTATDSIPNRDGVDTLSNIEFLQFSDKTLFVETSNNANIARLYSAAFDRAPDSAGLSFWEDIYASNIPAAAKSAGYYTALAQANDGAGASIAANFMQSSEFQSHYGSLTDAAFVNLLYQNVLGRPADQAGLNFWLGQLEGGGQTRAVVLVGFAESPENVAKASADWLISI